jgi:molecular chaperone HtpG
MGENKAQSFQYKAEMKQLLDILIHSLYTNPDVFLRELISNSSDALNKIRFRKLTDSNVLDVDAELKITLEFDKEAGTFSISDTGIGMTHDDLINRIGTVAGSGTAEFVKNIKEGEKIDADMIGRFGVGFYSVFMVTDECVIETRHADPDSKGYRWVSHGEDNFTVEEIEKAERGTKISFKLKDEYKEYAEDYKVKSVLNKYSNFVDFPIYIGEEKVNAVKALWHKKDSEIEEKEYEEFYKFISNDFQEPLGHLKFDIEGRVNFKAMIFIPAFAPPTLFQDRDAKNLQLYSSNVFIQDDNPNLLPDYLKFLKGVVDTEDLPLNVSREVTQNSPVVAKISDIITGKILTYFEKMADKEPEKYDKFWSQFGTMFKLGANSDFSNKERIMELLRFESSTTEAGKTTSLNSYISKADTDQDTIYYIAGNSRDGVEKNPNLEYFKNKGIEVLYLLDPTDLFVVPYLHEYEGKKFQSIDKADIEIDKTDENEENKLEDDKKTSLIEFIKNELGDKVEDVIESKRLVDSACTLVVGEKGMDPQMEKMMQMMDKNFSASKRIFEVNMSHPLIKNLSAMHSADAESKKLKDAVNQLFNGAMLIEGYLKDPADFVKIMTDMMVDATK